MATKKPNTEINTSTNTTITPLAYDDMFTTAVSDKQYPEVFENVDDQSSRVPQFKAQAMSRTDNNANNSKPNTHESTLLSGMTASRKEPNKQVMSVADNNRISAAQTTNTASDPVPTNYAATNASRGK